MKTKTLKKMQIEVWQAKADRQALIGELKAAGIARDMMGAQLNRLAKVVHAAAIFVESQPPHRDVPEPAEAFRNLKAALEELTTPPPTGKGHATPG